MESYGTILDWAVVLDSGFDAGVGVWRNISVRDPNRRPQRPLAFRILFPLVTVVNAELQPPIHGPDLSYQPVTRQNGIPGPFYEVTRYPMLPVRVHADPVVAADDEEEEAGAPADAPRPAYQLPGVEYSPGEAGRMAHLYRYGMKVDGNPKRKPGRKRGRGYGKRQ